ncbi:GntR family transcriptional regulator [Streptomyces mashuensis]|nr:winged helix-turn-helix domain-containing protein [Streptomyces mashuensis]
MDEAKRALVDPSKPVYVYMQVADHIAEEIATGRIPKGARLTGEREMAAEYRVAIGTIRRAVQELRDRGLLVTLPAKGTFVTQQPPVNDATEV